MRCRNFGTKEAYEAMDEMILTTSPSMDPAGGGLDSVIAEIIELLAAGGPVVAVLCALSFFATMVGIAKIMQFHTLKLGERVIPRQALQLWERGEGARAASLAAQSSSPLAQALARGMRGFERNIPEPRIREEVARYCNDTLADLRGWFRPLEVIAALAPLLGLFGTVLGMIEAFQQLEQAGNQVNPAILSGGIWVALLTTAVGLAVAIPVVALLNWLESRVDGLEHVMQSAVTRLFTDNLSLNPGQPECIGEADGDFAYSAPAIAAGE